MTSKKTFCYFFGMFTSFIQHVFLITQKHLVTENPTSGKTGKTCKAFLIHQPSKIPTTSRHYQAKTKMLISPRKAFDLKMKRYVLNMNKHVK